MTHVDKLPGTVPVLEYIPNTRVENPYLINDYLRLPSYELEEDRLVIHDVVWGDCEIGNKPYDELLVKLAHTPSFQRLQAIEQLTLGPDYATMPNTTDFSRWQHIWGSLVFVRKMVEGDERFSERDRAVMELRTLLSDVGHTSFSHLGDWLFQGIDGGENLHDQGLKEILSETGVQELLAEYGFSLEEVVFPEVEDWVECPSPNLCVDRVDYGMREILRWGTPTIPLDYYLQELEDPKNFFEITEQGQLALKNANAARYFCAGFSILPTEHWSHPTHRLQLELLQTVIKSALADEASRSSSHPREMMYGIDADFSTYLQSWDALPLHTSMKEIAVWQRRIFTEARRYDLNKVFSGIMQPEWQFPTFPDPLKSYSWQTDKLAFKPIPPHLDIVESSSVVEQAMRVSERGLEVDLPPLKARAIDPLVMVDGVPTQYSHIEPSYNAYLAGQRAVMAKGYKATVLMRTDIASQVASASANVAKEWTRLQARQRNADSLTRKVIDSALDSVHSRFDTFSDRQP